MAKLTIRDGVSQDERLLPALKEGYINVDEMRFEDLLSLAAEYGSFLKYHDLGNRPDGNWSDFFGGDEVFVLASIISTNLNGISADFSALERDGFALLQEDGAGIDKLPAYRLARKMDTWLTALGRLSTVAAVRARERIADVIEKSLRTELQKLYFFLLQYREEEAESTFLEFGPVWCCSVKPSMAGAGIPDRTAGTQAITKFLKSNLHAFRNAISFLQGEAGAILSSSLERRNHDPSAGLYIAFLRLFEKVQDRLNVFTDRHLNFYYEDILKIKRREFVPDSAYLIFSPDRPAQEVPVPKGTEFRAGLDENDTELIYAADGDLLVTDARVCALHTLYFERDSLSSPENGLTWRGERSKRFSTAAKLNRISVQDETGAPAKGGLPSYPLFGSPERSKAKSLFEEARMGFAVASNVLLMKHGERDISLTFKFSPHEEGGEPARFVDELCKVLATSRADAFFKAFRHMFRISLTGEAGWFEVEEYLPLCSLVDETCEEDSFKIRMHLPDSAGAVAAYTPEIHGEGFDTDLPIVKFVVNPDAYLYPYSFLCEMVVREIAVEVDVRGCTDILVYNQLGPLSASAQFNPFGPLPSPGDYFVVGNYEAARKRLLGFEVDVEWGGLPQDMNGFEEYYRAYPGSFGNSCFKASLAVLRDRKWIPAAEKEQPETTLFQPGDGGDEKEGNKVGRNRRFSFQGVCKFMRPLENIPEERFAYDALAKDGFFKLTLTDPPEAFGHKDYPLILSKVMIENASLRKFGPAKLVSRSLPPKPLPNQPYTPLINSISINYRAASLISLERVASGEEERLKEKMFHLHPLGIESVASRDYGYTRLVPKYETDGNLFIGLSASRLSGPLTLFFHLRNDSLPEASAKSFAFSWYYLSSGRWKCFEKSQVVSDTTNGFLSSGIVTLDIPADIDRASAIMPGNLYWLRVSVDDGDMHTLCSLYGIHTQALRVSWIMREGNSLSHLSARLPSGTIKEPKSSIPGIGGIRQITDSFDGEPPESITQRTIRVSERLRHKNRAITPWDYERLILQRFPEIYKVKCFPCMTDGEESARRVMPGHLLIVVIPYMQETISTNLRPMVNALMLREVREFVKGLSSAFVKIEVRNPAYEQVQVRCKVRFKRGAGRGFLLKELNREIVDYLSPWGSVGLDAKFGWRIRSDDVQSHIQGLGYVESVSGLSLLRIMESDDRRHHRLTDTARDMDREIRPGHPWSIAIPVKHHLIEVVDEQGVWPAEAQATGIARLAIGGTFILSRGNQ